MKYTLYIFLLLSLMTGLSVSCQPNNSINELNYFGIDNTNSIIVCQESYIKREVGNRSTTETLKLGNKTFTFTEAQSNLNTSTVYEVSNNGNTYKLYITSLPLMKVSANQDIVDLKKNPANLSYADPNYNLESPIGIELRGNTALTYPKKSYDLELKDEDAPSKTIDANFSEMRDDDDWHLNSLYNQPLKLRSFFSTKLWLNVNTLNYAAKEPDAKPGHDVEFVELFLNDTYQGLYSLSEQVDRKLLKLKKKKDNVVRGELYKANSYDQGTKFIGSPMFDENSLYWAGFKAKYPFKDDYKASWNKLADFMSFVSSSSDAEFSNGINTRLDIDNVIDYYLFVNLLRASDNLNKNYFLAKYNQKTPYFIVPWDLDGVMGSIQDGKRIPYATDVLSNALFDRLIKTNPDNFNEKLKSRWKELRSGAYSDESLFNALDESYTLLKSGHVYERDNMIWKQGKDIDEEYTYLKDWLQRRLAFLDEQF